MKKVTLFIFSLIIYVSAFAQTAATKHDVVLKLNGDELIGKVTSITDDAIKFVYTGETLEYTIKKADILKITHASGRVEILNKPALPSEEKKDDVGAGAPLDKSAHRNKIAILPFSYIRDNQDGGDKVGYKAQNDTYTYLIQHSAGYTIIDPRTTNALLIKAGVTRDKMMGFTMQEICNILGVEFLIDGTVTQSKGMQTSYSSDNSSTTVKRTDNDKAKVNSSGSTYSNSEQRYVISVGINIYNDDNASIYNQEHKAFFTNTDGSFSSPLEYLLKRSPLYRK